MLSSDPSANLTLALFLFMWVRLNAQRGVGSLQFTLFKGNQLTSLLFLCALKFETNMTHTAVYKYIE